MIHQNKNLFQKTSEEDLLQFDVQHTADVFQSSFPLLWNVLKTVASKNAKIYNTVNVLTAAFVLLNSRSNI